MGIHQVDVFVLGLDATGDRRTGTMEKQDPLHHPPIHQMSAIGFFDSTSAWRPNSRPSCYVFHFPFTDGTHFESHEADKDSSIQRQTRNWSFPSSSARFSSRGPSHFSNTSLPMNRWHRNGCEKNRQIHLPGILKNGILETETP